MNFYLSILQLFGPHILIGMSAYLVMLTGQISLAQAGFYAIGAYASGMGTVMLNLPIIPALLLGALVAGVFATAVGFPALRVKGLMLVVATLVFTQLVQIFCFNFTYQIEKGGEKVGPVMGEGLRQIRYFNAHGWTPVQVTLLVWVLVALVIGALWWVDHSRLGAILRAVGENEVAAQSAGVNLTAIKVFAVGVSGFIAGLGGGLHAHLTTHIEQSHFGILLAVLAISYPLIGGTGTVFGSLLGVIFIQGVLVEGLRFLGDWRNVLFGALIIVVANFLPMGILSPRLSQRLHRRLFVRARTHV